jgi:hypothetical protein
VVRRMSARDLIGLRVEMLASDHPHSGESGVVVRVEPCALCEGDLCAGEDLIVRLDDGSETRVFEYEADLVR